MMIKQVIASIKDTIQGKPNNLRSPQWETVRKAHIKLHPKCAACGGSVKLQVHHIKPFHLHPELELDPTNLMTLCEAGGLNCHLTFGHLGNFKSFNKSVTTDVKIWFKKITTRPIGNDDE